MRLSILCRFVVPAVLAGVLGAVPAGAVTYTVTANADSGAGSLRQAILDANTNAGADTIHFAIGTGLQTVAVDSGGLPALTDPVILDATTQPGWSGSPLIQLDGNGATGATAGLLIHTENSLIQGFIVHSFPDEGIEISGSTGSGDNNVIRGNWVGIDASQAAAPNADYGIMITVDAVGNVVGGPGPDDGNVSCANGSSGIVIRGTGTTGSVVIGNLIGVKPDGVTPLGNAVHGIEIYDLAQNSRIGGTTADSANVIANAGAGDGISILNGSGNNHAIVGNSIYDNFQRGIDLAADGVSLNDAGDGDTGPNDLLNFPVIYHAMILGGNVTVAGEGRPGISVEIFEANNDTPAYGEGETFVGRGTVPGAGTPGVVDPTAVQFSLTVPVGSLVVGDSVTATATDATSGTSEFSLNAMAGTFVVNTTSDVADGDTTSIGNLAGTPGPDGVISLREAISAANNTVGTDTIRFDIPDPLVAGAHTISPGAALPFIAGGVFLDGASEPDFAGVPVVELDGSALAGTEDGLVLASGSDGSTIRALAINRFPLNGILMSSGGNTLTGNHVGTDVTGTVALPNADDGIDITGDGNVIGGTIASDRNVVSGNGDEGLQTSAGTTGNQVLGNHVGVNLAGTAPLANGQHGLAIRGSGHTIGGPGGAGNVVSGNGGYGIEVEGTGTVIAGNRIGTNAAGDAAIGNAGSGIRIQSGATGITVGGTGAGEGNVISGNDDGIFVNGIGTSATIQGNLIGTDAAGMSALPNLDRGVQIDNGASGSLVGGSSAAARNLISGNANDGVLIADNSAAGTTGNVVSGNWIGTDAAGSGNLGNGSFGVRIIEPDSNRVGGAAAGEGNVIAFNAQDGVGLTSASGVGNAVVANDIHTNGGLGIDIANDGVTANDAGDGDAGPNDALNFPVITQAVEQGGIVLVDFDLDVPAGTYRVEFFANPGGADPSGNGEAEVFLSPVQVDHAGLGPESFSHSLAGSVGDVLTATTTACTDTVACTTFGSSSELSGAFPVAAGTPLAIVKTAFLTDGSPVSSGTILPRGTEVEFLLYVNNRGGAVNDLSVRDVLDPGFTYIPSSILLDSSTPGCAADSCTAAEVAAIYAAVAGGSPGTDLLDADVVSVAADSVLAGDQDVPNARLDVAADRVWALRLTVRVE